MHSLTFADTRRSLSWATLGFALCMADAHAQRGARWDLRIDGPLAGILRAAGDFDGDGRDDYAIGETAGTVTVYSGVDAAVLATLTNNFGLFDFDIARDMDSDGVREAFFTGVFGTTLVSGASNTQIWNSFDFAQRNIGDLNFDGYDDFAAALPGIASAFTLAISGVDGTPLGWSLPIPAVSSLFIQPRLELSPLGDTDDDGRADWVVGYSNQDTPEVSGLLVVSGNNATIADITLTTVGAFDQLTTCDVDGDGTLDIVVHGDNGMLEIRDGDTTLRSSLDIGAIEDIASVGDVDGDGFGDVAVDTGSVVVVRHGPDLVHTSTTGLAELARGEQGHDMNGDGFADVLGRDSNGDVAIATRHVVQYGVQTTFEDLGPATTFVEDFDADLVTDLAIGTPDDALQAGRTDFFSGQTQLAAGAPAIGAAAGNELGRSIARFVDPVQGPAVLIGEPSVAAGQGQVTVQAPLFGTTYTRAGQAAGDSYGAAVASAGDVNNDGFEDFVAGAPGGNYAEILSGAFLNVQTGPEVLHTETGIAPVQNLGFAVDGAGDVNGDGFDDVIISDPLANTGSPNQGVVYVVSGEWITSTLAATTPVTAQYLHQIIGIQSTGEFGYAVSGFGDANGNGTPDFAVGAPTEDFGGNLGSGAVRVFDGSGQLLLETGYAAGDRGGFTLAPAGDLDADGDDDLAIGLPGFDNDRGRLVVLSINPQRALLQIDGRAIGDEFATDLAGGEDVNGDGIADLLAAAASGGALGGPYVQLLAGQSDWQMSKMLHYGAGCADPAGVQPRIGLSGTPVLGEDVHILLEAAPPGSFAVQRLGFIPVSNQSPLFPGCTDLVASLSTLFVFPDAAGRASRLLTVPNNPLFLTVRLRAQWWAFTTTLSTTDGLQFEVGQRPGPGGS